MLSWPFSVVLNDIQGNPLLDSSTQVTFGFVLFWMDSCAWFCSWSCLHKLIYEFLMFYFILVVWFSLFFMKLFEAIRSQSSYFCCCILWTIQFPFFIFFLSPFSIWLLFIWNISKGIPLLEALCCLLSMTKICFCDAWRGILDINQILTLYSFVVFNQVQLSSIKHVWSHGRTSWPFSQTWYVEDMIFLSPVFMISSGLFIMVSKASEVLHSAKLLHSCWDSITDTLEWILSWTTAFWFS